MFVRNLPALALGLVLSLPAAAVRADDAPDAKAVGVPQSSKVTGLELPADQEVSGKQRVVFVPAKAAGKVKWVVLNANSDTPVQSMELSSSKTLLVFPADQDDLIIVMAYTVVDGEPSETARTLITVKGSGDKPGPGPGPNPPAPPAPPAAGPLHVTFIVDFEKQTPDIAAAINDRDLRQYLSSGKHQVHVVGVKSKSVVEDGLSGPLGQAGGPPAVVLQDAQGVVLAASKFKTSADVRQLVDKVVGGK